MSRSGVSQPDKEASPRFFSGSIPGLNAVKRQITRNRTSYSCATCRRRKVKCDKGHPVCGGCRKAKEQCKYGPDDALSANPPTSIGDEENNSQPKKRKISPPSQTSSTSPSASTSNEVAPPAQLKAIEEQLYRLTSMIDSLRQKASNDIQFQDLLTPIASSSDSNSHQHQGLSLDMFQKKAPRPVRDTSELTTPFSGLKLTPGNRLPDNPFWSHISEELDQLNQLMRGRTSDYVRAAGIQDKPLHQDCPRISNGHPTMERDDFWDPTSFRKQAGQDVPHSYDPDSDCPVCQMMPFAKSTLLQGIPIRCSPASAKHHLLKNMPSRTQSNVLLRCWLSGVYPIMPILNPPELVDKHEAFWTDIETFQSADTNPPDLDFFALINAVWYTASLSISAQGLQHWFPETSRAKLASSFHDQVVFSLHLGSFTRNITLQKLAALILLISLPIAEEDPIQASLYMHLVVRLASTMGLHREPTLFGVSVSEEGLRRRLWWQIIQLDVSFIAACGFPSQISEAFCDTNIICEGRDSALDGEDGNGVHSDQSRKVSPSSDDYDEQSKRSSQRTLKLIGRARSIAACALRSVVSTHLGTKMLTNTDMQEMKRVIQESGDEVDAIIKLIPARGLPELGFVPDGAKDNSQRALDCDPSMANPVSTNETTYYKTYSGDEAVSAPLARYHRQKLTAYNKWARISLSMLKDKIACVAYAPFLKNAKSKLWSVGRQCALHNCHSFMRKFISLATDPELEPFRWTWPAMHGPLHAAMIALVDLYERPDSVEAPRTRELIDRIFALSAPESGIVGGPNGVTVQRPLREGGLEAWDMLRGLRSAAWQKAGLDPTVLWTEDDHLKIGLASPLTDSQKMAQSMREDTMYHDHVGYTMDMNILMKDSKSEPKTTEDGVRYMVRLAQIDVIGTEDESQGYPCTRALRNQYLKEIENDDRLNRRNRGLVRRRGQQAMPFPLSGRMEQCSGKVAAGPLPQDSLLQLNGHLPIAGHHTGRLSDAAHGEIRARQGETIPLGLYHDPGLQDHRPTSGSTGPPGVQPDAQTIEPQADGPVVVNGLKNGYSSNPHHQQVYDMQSHQHGPTPELHHDGSPVTDGELGFDWERWDAVFGQYSGFTDLMEDVTWADYVDE
ncbi:hypothetical protein A1O3_04377 [Capronia epimyces CBS 606.96]|uniref:Zn(2)-C6 fungal-type domain-containing protein n=1 Tax=Capronia epimyces CBS 606.96 TaxID=1182542 RepID=W9Y3P6_9EURO|nr:uncharacterized protein A1O3_04377 [Capronia epimyces CBS 606.96]EXJ87417.1 hypothetical protein A1O3_04377 [Capronia epimyces CBS 606.96]